MLQFCLLLLFTEAHLEPSQASTMELCYEKKEVNYFRKKGFLVYVRRDSKYASGLLSHDKYTIAHIASTETVAWNCSLKKLF